jgi:hypothetical protein
VKLDLDVGGRNCDRAVERSTALEEGDEILALPLSYTLEVKPQAATPERKSSAGVTASPGQPFCTGPSTTKW